ncbi:iron-containing alcohol dehydrogenase [Myxococcota bacterium]|nr:iron-containing alcohol dehydrogenase [Myxococcota bacterium]
MMAALPNDSLSPFERRAARRAKAGRAEGFSRHISLVGLSGSGKSSLGKKLSSLLAHRFVDLEKEVTSKIKNIDMRDPGGVARRARERSIIRDVFETEERLVFATSESTFSDPTMRKWLRENTLTIYLATSPKEIVLRRAEQDPGLRENDIRAASAERAIKRVLRRQEIYYQEAEQNLNTDGKSLSALAEILLNTLLPSKKEFASSSPRTSQRNIREQSPLAGNKNLLHLHSSAGEFNIHYTETSGLSLIEEIVTACTGPRIAIITDPNISQHHLDKLEGQLIEKGKLVSIHLVEEGEESKNTGVVAQLSDALFDAGLEKDDSLIALGGGVISDITAFSAGLFEKKLNFIQIPTTTGAALNASCSGIAQLHSGRRQNALTLKIAPKIVFIVSDFLKTQPLSAHLTGLTEAVAIALSQDLELLDHISRNAERLMRFETQDLFTMLRKATHYKTQGFSRREKKYPHGIPLKLGETIGHAIEVGEEFQINPAEAHALGMIAEAEWAESEGWAVRTSTLLQRTFDRMGLSDSWSEKQISISSLGEKQNKLGALIKIQTLVKPGEVKTREIPLSLLKSFVTTRRHP